jgi:hypothetical protein
VLTLITFICYNYFWMSSKKCNCASSKLFPHRADKCTFSKKKPSAPNDNKESNQPKPEEVVVPNPETQNVETDIVTENVEQPVSGDTGAEEEIVSEKGEDDVVSANENLPDGNENCNCMMYKVKKHRKKNCRWKKHVATALAVTAGVAAVVAVGVLAAAAVNKNDDSNDADVDNDLAPDVERIQIADDTQTAEAKRLRLEAEAEQRRLAEEELVERARRERIAQLEREATLAEQRRLAEEATAAAVAEERARQERAAQLEREAAQRRLEQQQRENEALRQAMIEQQRQQEIERERLRQQAQQSTVFISAPSTNYSNTTYVQSTTTYRSSSSSSVSSRSTGYAKYGTTLKGEPCKNCIRVGGRCHQHPY